MPCHLNDHFGACPRSRFQIKVSAKLVPAYVLQGEAGIAAGIAQFRNHTPISVDNRDYLHPSRFEIVGAKRISQHLSKPKRLGSFAEPSFRLPDLSRLGGGRHRCNLFEVARFDESLLGLDSLGFVAVADEPKYDSEGQGGASQCCN